ncbi:MAG TPA: hypothetical protein VIH90_04575 [Candidatus Saccharimonadales bacterium]
MSVLRPLRPKTPEDILPLLRKDPNRGLHTGEAMWVVPGGDELGPEPPMRYQGYFLAKGRIIGPAASLNASLHSTWGNYETGSVDEITVVNFGLSQVRHSGDDPISLTHFWFQAPEIDLETEGKTLLVAARGLYRYINGYSEEESAAVSSQVEANREPSLPGYQELLELAKPYFPDDPMMQ